LRLTVAAILLASFAYSQAIDPVRSELLARMDTEAPRYAKLSRQIWEFAEIGYQETKSSALLAGELKQAGFRVETGVANMPTAFIATWGQGKPVIAILGEYDALPGLSQDAVPEKKPVVPNGNGHGCGHNTFGVAAAHGAIAAKRVMEQRKLPGTIRFFGTPAEEGGGGKIHIIRAGLFKDVDAAITWHPWDRTGASNQQWLANTAARFRFTGRAAHAAAAPDQGRSALDAAMVMTHAIDLMREHVPQETRMHYILEKAGAAPNIVPESTEVVMMARHPDAAVLAGIWERVMNCAQAGALATGTQMSFEVTSSYANMQTNRTLSAALDRSLRAVGGYRYTPEEQQFADAIRRTLGSTSAPPDLHEKVLPAQDGILSASTDVGDVSWVVPTAQFNAATWVPGTAAHTWQSTAASGMSIGQKGMLLAAKTFALTTLDLLTDPKLIAAARAEFDKAMASRVYKTQHPKEIRLR
jgi:aminobenzoyl-glutamate utilization protein B